MISAALFQTKDQNLIEITGHAKDKKVCAGVSMIVETAFHYILNSEDIEVLEARIERGNYYTAVKRSPESDFLFRHTAMALSLVERSFKKEITLHIDRHAGKTAERRENVEHQIA